MKLIVGLGNPGPRYRNTRHNVGFLVVKEIRDRFGISTRKKIYKGLFGKGSIENEETGLFLPQTYMNLSGEAVREMAKLEKIEPENLLVIYDDIDLKFGFMRLKKKGSAGGHKGLESIIRSLDTSEFPRLRIGIGKDHKVSNVVKFVLNSFDSKERPLLKDVINRATECAVTWTREGPEKAMTRFNRRQFP